MDEAAVGGGGGGGGGMGRAREWTTTKTHLKKSKRRGKCCKVRKNQGEKNIKAKRKERTVKTSADS